MTSQNLSNYSASSILRKVNEALSAKSASSRDDNDILELLEEADSSSIEGDKSQETLIETSKELHSSHTANSKETISELKPEKTSEENIQGLNKMNEKLISANTAETTSAILQELKKKTPKNKGETDQLMFDSGATIEGMVIELIKPYLSTWLDQNLTLIVKNIVEKEVKKLIPSED